jgi:hypothetical protein
MPAVFSTAYLPCIAWFQHFMEAHEHYSRQTYRNRCRILSANGVLALSIPVEHPGKTLITDVKCSVDSDWKRQHWESLKAAYGKSAYWIYYADELETHYKDKTALTLCEWNEGLIRLLLKWMKVDVELKYTATYQHQLENDLRNAFDPKAKDPAKELLHSKSYLQVFDMKFGFQPNLSIIDLLFAEGPAAKGFLV